MPVETVESYRAYAERVRLIRRVRGGGAWMYWVAALSLSGVVAFLTGNDWGLVIGFGVSEAFHSLAVIAAANDAPSAGWLLAFAIVADLFAAGVIAVAGSFARRRDLLGFQCGIALYAGDALLCLYGAKPMHAAFHGFALIGMLIGAIALHRLNRLERAQADVATAAA